MLYIEYSLQRRKMRKKDKDTLMINVLYHLDTLYYQICPQEKKKVSEGHDKYSNQCTQLDLLQAMAANQ